MAEEDWNNPETRCFGIGLAGDAIDEVDERGNRIVDDTLLILLNSHYEPVPFVLRAHSSNTPWELVLDTQEPTGKREYQDVEGGETYELASRSVAVFCLRREEE